MGMFITEEMLVAMAALTVGVGIIMRIATVVNGIGAIMVTDAEMGRSGGHFVETRITRMALKILG